MAKGTSAKSVEKEKAPKTKAPESKFGVNELIAATGLQAASVRVALRELGVEKAAGGRYGWDNQKDFDAVVKAMKERSAKRVAKPKDDGDAKPAKAASKTKPAGKGKGKSK